MNLTSGLNFRGQYLAQSSSLKIFHSIFQVLDSTTSTATADMISLPSLLFKPIFTKRSLMTPRWLHPAEEENLEREEYQKEITTKAEPEDAPMHSEDQNNPVFTLEKENPQSANADSLSSPAILEPTLTNEAMIVMELLKDAPMNFDELLENTMLDIPKLSLAITDLEIAGLVISLPGDKFKRLEETGANTNHQGSPTFPKKLSKELFNNYTEEYLTGTIDSSLRSVIEAARLRFLLLIKTHFQGISRKYLALYLALRNYLDLSAKNSETREPWAGRQGQSEIFDLCLLSRNKSFQSSRYFVTALQTKFYLKADSK